MKTSFITTILAIGALAFVQFCTGCAGLTVTASSPWGDVSSLDGQTTVAVRPIIIEK